ncbi:MAG: hypothetical protein GF308_03880 [Candidatus Heimdallarchaeota archaeon]|nr:hypothetical protein [Candidatus Heimdallarchaeota archaeon]
MPMFQKSYNGTILIIISWITCNILFFVPLIPFINLLTGFLVYSYLFVMFGRLFSTYFKPFRKSKYLFPFLLGYICFSLSVFVIALVGQFSRTAFIILANIMFLSVFLFELYNSIKAKKGKKDIGWKFFINCNSSIFSSIKFFLKKHIPLILLISLNFVVRIVLFFIGSEIGVDTFRINYLAYVLIKDEYLSFAPTIIQLLNLDTYSEFPIPVIQVASFSILTQLSIEHATLLTDIFLSNVALFGIWIFCTKIIAWNKKLTTICSSLFVFSPLFLKFSGWSLIGRTIFFAFVPFALYLGELLIIQKQIRILVLNILLSTLLIFSHRMGLLHIFYITNRVIIDLIVNYLSKKPSQLITFNVLLSLIGILLFFMPSIFLMAGNSTFTSSFLYKDRLQGFEVHPIENSSNFENAIIILSNISLLFLVRMSIIFVLFLFELFSFPIRNYRICFSEKRLVLKSYLTIKAITILFFPILFFAPYTYQMSFMLYTILATFGIQRLYYFLIWIGKKIKEKKPSFTFDREIIQNKYFFITFIIIFTILPGLFIETVRYDFFILDSNNVNSQYITDEVRELAYFINNNFENNSFYCEYLRLSFQLSALSPTNKYYPTKYNFLPSYGKMDLNKQPKLNLTIESFYDFYRFIVTPIFYENYTSLHYIRKVPYWSLNNSDLVKTIKIWDISYAIFKKNSSSSTIFFQELNQKGDFIYTSENYVIANLGFLLN